MIKRKIRNYDLLKKYCDRMLPGGVVLDYGCGENQLVDTLNANGFDAYGCDIIIQKENDKVKLINHSFEIPLGVRNLILLSVIKF